MSQIRCALIGAGRIGQVYALAMQDKTIVQSARLAIVADVDQTKARRLAEGARADWCQPDDVLSRTIDAVIIATPPNTHEMLVRSFLRRGVHVLCEKPLSVNLASVRTIIALASETRTILAVSSPFLFDGGVETVTKVVKMGAVGPPIALKLTFAHAVDLAGRWLADPSVSGGGVLIDRGPHALDLVQTLIGPIVMVRAKAQVLSEYSVEDDIRLHVKASAGVSANCWLSWRTTSLSGVYCEFLTRDAVFKLGWRNCVMTDRNGDERAFALGYDRMAAFGKQVRAFVRTIAGDAFPWPPHDIVLKTSAAIEAAYVSSLNGSRDVALQL